MEINPDTLEIEIVDIEPIDGGVQVFARAWNDGKQIGFGKDGSVDIERFRIFNPPILVDDPQGDIVITDEVQDPVTSTTRKTVRTLREDPEQALITSLIDTILSIKNIHSADNIISGKRGNTTSTFYSGGGDTNMAGNLGGGSFTAQRNAATANTGVYGGSPNWGFLARNTVYLYRAFFPFDTSALPDTDNIDSAVFSVKPASDYNNGCSVTAYLVPFAPANPASLVVADWGTITFTDYGNRVWSAASVGNYFDITLTAAGLSGINKTGFTNLAFISNYDFLDTTPCNSTTNNGAQLYYSEASGTTNDPKLVIEHSAGGGGGYRFNPQIRSFARL